MGPRHNAALGLRSIREYVCRLRIVRVCEYFLLAETGINLEGGMQCFFYRRTMLVSCCWIFWCFVSGSGIYESLQGYTENLEMENTNN